MDKRLSAGWAKKSSGHSPFHLFAFILHYCFKNKKMYAVLLVFPQPLQNSKLSNPNILITTVLMGYMWRRKLLCIISLRKME